MSGCKENWKKHYTQSHNVQLAIRNYSGPCAAQSSVCETLTPSKGLLGTPASLSAERFAWGRLRWGSGDFLPDVSVCWRLWWRRGYLYLAALQIRRPLLNAISPSLKVNLERSSFKWEGCFKIAFAPLSLWITDVLLIFRVHRLFCDKARLLGGGCHLLQGNTIVFVFSEGLFFMFRVAFSYHSMICRTFNKDGHLGPGAL